MMLFFSGSPPSERAGPAIVMTFVILALTRRATNTIIGFYPSVLRSICASKSQRAPRGDIEATEQTVFDSVNSVSELRALCVPRGLHAGVMEARLLRCGSAP
jgi:hypothetical protein